MKSSKRKFVRQLPAGTFIKGQGGGMYHATISFQNKKCLETGKYFPVAGKRWQVMLLMIPLIRKKTG